MFQKHSKYVPKVPNCSITFKNISKNVPKCFRQETKAVISIVSVVAIVAVIAVKVVVVVRTVRTIVAFRTVRTVTSVSFRLDFS